MVKMTYHDCFQKMTTSHLKVKKKTQRTRNTIRSNLMMIKSQSKVMAVPPNSTKLNTL